jgi:pentatricopeptide repeat protein
MEAARLYQLMENPSLLDAATLAELSAIVRDYPYFHAARLLYLKNLAVLNDARFDEELKKTAVYVPDRRALYRLIEESGTAPNAGATQPDGKEDSFALIDRFLNSLGEDANQLPDEPPTASDYLYGAAKEPASKEKSGGVPPLRHQELIDSFLEKEEERKAGSPPGFAEAANEAPDAHDEHAPNDDEPKDLGDSYFTETLAKVYVKQKRYEKALEIFQRLSAKYPGENVYFADQIRFLEQVITNIKK